MSFLRKLCTGTQATGNARLFVLGGVLALTAFLRSYRLDELGIFTPVQGSEFLEAYTAIKEHRIPLTGIESGVRGIHQGPLFTLMLIPIIGLSQGNPEATAVVAVTLGIFTIWVTFLVAEKLGGVRSATLAALFLAASPLGVIYARFLSHTSLLPLLLLFYLMVLLKVARRGTNRPLAWTLVAVFSWAALTEVKVINATLILLIPVALFLRLPRRKHSWDFAKIATNGILRNSSRPWITLALPLSLTPLLPRIIWELQEDRGELTRVVQWLLQRTQAILTELPGSLTGPLGTISIYMRQAISWDSALISGVIVSLTIMGSIFRLVNEQNRQSRVTLIILLSWLLVASGSMVFYGEPSQSQLVTFLPILAILVGQVFSHSRLPTTLVRTLTVIMILTSLRNISVLLSGKMLSAATDEGDRYGTQSRLPQLSEQRRMVDRILKDSQGKPFSLESQDSNKSIDNYRYLLVIQRARLTEDARLIYSIGSSKQDIGPNQRMYYFEGASIIRDEPINHAR